MHSLMEKHHTITFAEKYIFQILINLSISDENMVKYIKYQN